MPGPGPLRQAVQDTVYQNFTPSGGPGWWDRVRSRWAEMDALYNQIKAKDVNILVRNSIFIGICIGLYTIFGAAWAKDSVSQLLTNNGIPDVSKDVAAALDTALDNPIIKEISETYGALFTEPFIAFFNQYAGREDIDQEEFVRALHGFPRTINLAAGLVDITFEMLGAGQFDAFGRINNDMIKSTGAEYIFYETIRPMIEAGLSTNLGRYFNKKYRPTRFAASDLRDLYALGRIAPDALREEARKLGWREQDIDQWIALAFRTMAQGDVFTAYQKGFIDQAEASTRLRALGYDPKDIPLLFKLNEKPENADAKSASAADARTAYRDGIVSEAELRALLAGLKYGSDDIDLIVSIEQYKLANTRRGLSVGQIKSAWSENVLTDQEAQHWLEQAGVVDDQIAILLDTWKAEIAPKFRQLNAGTIVSAYVNGVIARAVAKSKLGEVGLSQDDAELELKLAEARNPDAFGSVTGAVSRKLTPGVLAELVGLQLLTQAQMTQRLVDLGYAPEDAALLSQAAALRAQPTAKTLSQGSISNAYLFGVIDRQQATDLFTSNGFSIDQANLILDTLEKANPEAFGVAPATRLRSLSPAQIESMYLDGLLDVNTYRQRLTELGFNQADIDLQVQQADLLKAPGQRVLTQSTIERAYLAGVFDRTTAYNRLVSLDFTPEAANAILDTVEASNPASFSPGLVQSMRTPSISVLVAAVANGVITQDDYLARAAEIGYAPDDALLYLSVGVNNVRKAAKTLTLSQVQEAYAKGFFNRGTALQHVSALGYSDEDATLLLRLAKESLTLTDTWDSMLAGTLDPFSAVSSLLNAHYTDQDILDAFSGLDPNTLASLQISLDQLKQALTSLPGGEGL